MKLKVIKQNLSQLEEQHSAGDVLANDLLAQLQSALEEKKLSCEHKLRHGANFKKREKAEKKLKKVKACLKKLKVLNSAASVLASGTA